MMNFLFEIKRRRYTVEKLQNVYNDLLRHIDVSNKDYSRRGDDNTVDENGIDDDLSAGSDEIYRISFTRAERRDVAAAFRILAATKSPDKEGNNLGAAVIRDDASVSALAIARNIETSVVSLIGKIGDIVVNGGRAQLRTTAHTKPQIRTDAVFEYFCEQRMLSMLVDIAKETRSSNNRNRQTSRSAHGSFHGVVWSPRVKAQVFRTMSLLISDVRNHPILFYLLSNNIVNEMISCMLPLQQWTDHALEKMMPAYVDLLTSLSLQLNNDPHIFPFLTIQENKSESSEFPLFSAALETATCNYSQSDSLVYGNCINVIISILHVEHVPIRRWVSEAEREQHALARHLCGRLLERYRRIGNLCTGPVVDHVRSNSIAGQIEGLKDQIGILNEVFWSGLSSLNVRLCETLLRQVISVVLNNMVPTGQRPFLVVGIVDGDVIPEREALAQVSAVFLTQLFLCMAHVPFLRMLAVAILHPQSTRAWDSTATSHPTSLEKYVLMPALNDIAEGKTKREEAPQNPFLSEIVKSIKGVYGDWRVVAVCVLLETIIKSDAMNSQILSSLDVIPEQFHGDNDSYPATCIEEALATFLNKSHTHPSPVSFMALECIGSLALQLIYHAALSVTEDGRSSGKLYSVFPDSPLWIGLTKALEFFCIQALKSQDVTGISDIFLDLVEAAISSRYTAHIDGSGTLTFVCSMSRRGCGGASSSEILVRKLRGVSSNDVESARYFVHMALNFRSLCRAVERLAGALEAKGHSPRALRGGEKKVTLDLVDEADELTRTIGGLVGKPSVGTDLDLRGRMTFRFFSAKSLQQTATRHQDVLSLTGGRMRNFSEDSGVFRISFHLMLVLDPTDMFVVRPSAQIEFNRGAVVTNVALRSVIAAAADGEWLHVAVRHEDVGSLIKNGNMALRFESVGTCLIVKQYLDRSRQVLRRELMGKVSTLFRESIE